MCVLLKYKVRTFVKRTEAVVNPDRYSASVKHATEKAHTNAGLTITGLIMVCMGMPLTRYDNIYTTWELVRVLKLN